jgi:hypothetical protein
MISYGFVRFVLNRIRKEEDGNIEGFQVVASLPGVGTD